MTLSDGRRQTGAFFSESRASLVRDFGRSRMHQSWSRRRRSVTCPLPRPLSSPSAGFIMEMGTSNRSWKGRGKEAKEGGREKGGRDKRTLPLQLVTSYNIAAVPSGKIELARNGSGISNSFDPYLSFEFIDTIGMIPAPSCLLASITLRVII